MGGADGYLARDNSRALRPDDAFRAASVTKSVTAAVAVRLACQGAWGSMSHWLASLPPSCLIAGPPWMLFRAPPPRQLLAHTSGLPNYFTDEAFAARLREDPGRAWRPAELVDHAAAHGTTRFPPGGGFEYCDTGAVGQQSQANCASFGRSFWRSRTPEPMRLPTRASLS